MQARDISTADDVKKLVDHFYEKVNEDAVLAPIFNDIAGVNWSAHLPTMYRFWESLLFGSGNYHGAPFPKHAVLPATQSHFERWLSLFIATVNENFAGPKADEAKGRAVAIADTFARRMNVLDHPHGFARVALSAMAYETSASSAAPQSQP